MRRKQVSRNCIIFRNRSNVAVTSKDDFKGLLFNEDSTTTFDKNTLSFIVEDGGESPKTFRLKDNPDYWNWMFGIYLLARERKNYYANYRK